MKAMVNDFAFKIATVNGTGSASANGLLMQSIFRMGIPVSGKNVFPSNIAIPKAGCWRLTFRSGEASGALTVLVRN